MTTNAFGGKWTEDKLSIVESYLTTYLQVLKKTNFRRYYIDAFAGTGTRDLGDDDPLLFEELEQFISGSARRALGLNPPFHEYIFIEKSGRKCAALSDLVREEFPHLQPHITIIKGDANTEIRKLCEGMDWYNERAALFLDPFATQVEWSTLEAIAGTKGIDLWILFPIAAINRNLPANGVVPDAFAQRLTRIFGTEEWRQALYVRKSRRSLFDEEDEEYQVSRGIDAIGEYFLDRLSTVFEGVADTPRVLANKTKTPLFLLCFAASNKKGAPIALRLAKHSLGKPAR